MINPILRPYQRAAAEFILANKMSALWMRPGLGKTLPTLEAIRILRDSVDASRVLIVGTKRIARDVWPQEIKKWGFDFDAACLAGLSAKKRADAAKGNEFVHVINRENLYWLLEQKGLRRVEKMKKDGSPSGRFKWEKTPDFHWPYDIVVLDESSMYKNQDSKSWKSARAALPFISRLIQLTGSPAANGYHDVYAQIYLLDQGQSLGRTLTAFRERWFTPSWDGFAYNIRQGAEIEINNAVAPVVFCLKTEDYLTLPETLVVDDVVTMDDDRIEKYKYFERESVLDLNPNDTVKATNAGALIQKLTQFANGAVYFYSHEQPNTRQTKVVHDEKIQALRAIVDELYDENLLVFYSHEADIARIKSTFSFAKHIDDVKDAEQEWNAGKIKLLLVHPKSAGHGLNLQFGGRTVVWFGLPWSLELYEQANQRLTGARQLSGPFANKPGVIRRIITAGTIDETIAKVLSTKDATQTALFDAVKRLIREQGN